MIENNITELSRKLETILRKCLNCHYTDFGVKANDNLAAHDWKSSVNFALGYKYAKSNNSPKVKEEINFFLGNVFIGENIKDVIEHYESYGFNTENEAYAYIDDTLNSLKEILFMDDSN